MSKGVTINVQLQQLASRMRIPYFRGIFMRTTLPKEVRRNESGIMNLDNTEGPDTLGGICKKGQSHNIFRQFWQSSTVEGISAIFRK